MFAGGFRQIRRSGKLRSMTFDRAKWTATLTKEESPAWPCPACTDGHLVPVAKTFFQEETPASEKNRKVSRGDWEPDCYEGRFIGSLRCVRPTCRELVVVCGTSVVMMEQDEDDGSMSLVDRLVPQFFHPAPPLFRPPNNCNKSIANELRRAWSLYWTDRASCANRIRTCLELLLDHIGVARKGKTKKGEYRPLNLHARIDRLRKRDAVLASRIMGVKWLGNAGSHEGTLNEDDLLNGIELMEDALAEVFGHRTKRLNQLSKELARKLSRKRRTSRDGT